MQKAWGHIQAVAGRILFIGLSVQIILGLLWMCCSFAGMQDFAESYYYIEVSESLLCDEYTGILYPFILMLVRSFVGVFGISYEPVMYLLQLGVALRAGWCFASAIGVKKRIWKLWASLVLLTFPMTMQCHVAVLPNSLAYSCFLLLTAEVLSQMQVSRQQAEENVLQQAEGRVSKEAVFGRRLVYIHGFWILAALLLPEYLLFGGVPVIVFLLYCRKQSVKKLLFHFILAAAAVGIIAGVNQLTQTEGSQGRVHSSAEATWFRRTAWTSLAPYYHLWPQEVKAAVSDDDFTATNNYAENMKDLFQPLLEEKLGVEYAREWFGEFGTRAFKDNYRQILSEIAVDMTGYMFPPAVMEMLLEGRGYSSYCARNYECMRQEAPLLTKYYVDYSAWWFVVGIMLATVWQLAGVLKSVKTLRRMGLCRVLLCIGTALLMALWYTMQEAGLWDYKKALFVGGLWMIWMIRSAYKGVQEVREVRQYDAED